MKRIPLIHLLCLAVTLAALMACASAAESPSPAPSPLTPASASAPASAPAAATAELSSTPPPASPSGSAPLAPSPTRPLPSAAALDAAAQAQALSDRLAQAGGPEPTYQALLQVMDALNLGVYAGAGQPVLRGAEQSANDLFVYDFELRMIAGSLARQERWTVQDLAALLGDLGFTNGKEKLTGEALARALRTVTRAAAEAPSDRLSLIPLLLRDLGRRQPQPYDLLQDLPPETLSFTALQRFLILVDAIVPLLRQPGSSLLPRAPLGSLRLLPAAEDPCASIKADLKKGSWRAGKLGAELYPGVSPETRQALLRANDLLNSMHQAVLQVGLRVERLSPIEQTTHYGHGEPGKKLEFKVRVFLADAKGLIETGVVRCGALTGVGLAEQGVGNLYVKWSDSGLDQHGRVTCGDQSCAQGTGQDGTVAIVFEPKFEKSPFGWGRVAEANGTVSASVGVVGALPANVRPAVASPIFEWTVGYHKQPKLTLAFESKIDGTNDGLLAVSHGKAEVPLEYDVHADLWNGQGALTYQTTPKPHDKCKAPVWNGSGVGIFSIKRGEIMGGEPSRGIAPQIKMYVGMGGGTPEIMSVWGNSGPPGWVACAKETRVESSFFGALWITGHLEGMVDGVGWPVPPSAWQFSNAQSGEFARATLKSTCKKLCVETTVLKLLAQPEE